MASKRKARPFPAMVYVIIDPSNDKDCPDQLIAADLVTDHLYTNGKRSSDVAAYKLVAVFRGRMVRGS